MGERAQTGRKRLLVAAVGVATVSLLGEQGCSSPRYETYSSGNLLPPPAQPADSGVTSEPDAGQVEARGSAREQHDEARGSAREQHDEAREQHDDAGR